MVLSETLVKNLLAGTLTNKQFKTLTLEGDMQAVSRYLYTYKTIIFDMKKETYRTTIFMHNDMPVLVDMYLGECQRVITDLPLVNMSGKVNGKLVNTNFLQVLLEVETNSWLIDNESYKDYRHGYGVIKDINNTEYQVQYIESKETGKRSYSLVEV